MAKKTGTRDSMSAGSPANRGTVGPAAIVIGTKVVTMTLLVLAFYFIAFFSAVRLVPLIMSFVLGGSGVTMDMPVETILAVWIAPSLFLIALLFTLALLTMRGMWRLRRTIITAVSRRVSPSTTDESAPIAIAKSAVGRAA